ncbi:hypothetical protein ONZ51_g741 [Trametes cubensis]|uniref:N-acetyltransferase domain-containing protein n=1 Tax=Trametes cubensis TaxID=1111947 RepID=A0AAD7U510_9APHY|nr:hypothetical protein ONZ51_g741 [Trametes cubensis]
MIDNLYFLPGPAAAALVGGDLSLVPSLASMIIRALLLVPGVGDMFTARDSEGALVGFTLFSLPGQLVLSTPEQQNVGRMSEFMERLSPDGRKYYAEVMAKGMPKANDEAFGIQDAERNTYWCHFAMVHKDYQGKGIVKALFNLATTELTHDSKAAKRNAKIALTTTSARNVPIYEKLGFTLYGHKVMPSPWADWQVWFFAKEVQLGEAQ